MLVCHDETLKRVYGVNKKVIDVKKGTRGKYTARLSEGMKKYSASDLYLPSLASFAKLINKYGMKAYIHIKSKTVSDWQIRQLRRITDKYGITDKSVIFSSRTPIVKRASAIFPNTGISFVRSPQLKYGFRGCADLVKKYGAQTAVFVYGGNSKSFMQGKDWITKSDISYIHNKGLKAILYQNSRNVDLTGQNKYGFDGFIQNANTPSEVTYIAHRGDVYYAQEGTIAALKAAGREGYGGAEFDIWFTKDGEVLVNHDSTLKKVYGVDRKVVDVKKGTRKKYVATKSENKTGKIPAADRYLPSLASALKTVHKYGIKTFIHIKNDTATKTELDRLRRILNKYGESDTTVFSGYSAVRKAISAYYKHTGAVYVKSDYRKAINMADIYGHDTVIFCYRGDKTDITRADVKYGHTRGLNIYVYAYNRKVDISGIYQLGLDGVIFNARSEEQLKALSKK